LTPSGNSCTWSCADVNCVTCSFDTTNGIYCVNCASGFIVNPSNKLQCIPCASGTYYSSSPISCVSCTSLNTYCLTCSSSSVCDSCGYSLTPSGTACSQVCTDPNCVTCSFTTTAGIYCNSCVSGFIVNPSNQLQCICPSGTYYSPSPASCVSCTSLNTYCLTCSSSSVCDSCGFSLTPSGNSCTWSCADVNCVTCSFDTTNGIYCVNCASGFIVNSSNQLQCIPCPSGTFYSPSPASCVSCTSLNAYCLTCSSSSVCDSCEYSLTPSGNACTPVCSDVNCVTCAFTIPKGIYCSACVSGYTVNPSNLLQCIPLCGDGILIGSEVCDDGNL
jgi:proprotein convertase subtilisin/kexin type 5